MAQKKKLNGMAENANDQYKYFASDVGSGVLSTANTNKAYQAAQPKTINVNGTTKTIQASGSPKINTDPDRPDNTGLPDDDGRPPYIPPAYNPPTYTSPVAGAQYSYNGTRPTWEWSQAEPTYSWNQAAPTYNWNQAAPTWSWDDSGRPGAFEWDDSGRPGEFQYDREAPTYNNAYQDRINSMVDQILNRPQFTYDYMQDPLYAQYADAYTRNGTQAMNDTLAQVSARTGGLASSYASNAAQQQYNQYMSALNDKVIDLHNLAYNMYRDQGNDMRNNLSMLQGLENTDYGRYMDALGQYNTDRNLAYNVWNSGLNQYNQDRNFAYNQYADQLAQYNTDRNFSYGQYQDAMNQYNNDRNFSFDQYQTALNQYNNNRNFDYGVYADALNQYNTDRNWDYNLWSDNIARQEAAAKAAYNSQVAAARAAAGANGGNSAPVEETAGWNSPYTDLQSAGVRTKEEAISYLMDVRGYDRNTAATIAEGYAGSLTQPAAPKTYKSAYEEDPDQYDYGVWPSKNGIEFMGKTYNSSGSVLSAIANANISANTKQNALEMAYRNGVITEQEYKYATGK